MASLPVRQQSQRRPSPEQAAAHPPPSPARAISATSEDSQTVFVNSTQPNTASGSPGQQQDHDAQGPQASRPPNPADDPSVKKCWICFSDSTEDTPETSPWRNPCPCALTAHEECLLDWIADVESPTKANQAGQRGRNLVSAPRIECPQCKSEIRLARPTNYIVDLVRGVERLGARVVTPGALTVLCATVYTSSMAWGVHSIYAIFGTEDGFRILRPLILNSTRPPAEVWLGELQPREAVDKILGLFVDHLAHWRLYVGLPLITPVLILSRTSLADSILPVLPILFFATQAHADGDQAVLDFTHWPPSASLAFAVLPYVRSAYNAYYRRFWAEKEKRWLREIQPRSGQQGQGAEGGNAEGAADGQALNAAEQRDADVGNVFEVRIDGGLWEDWEEEAEAEAEEDGEDGQPPMAPPLNQPPLEDEDQAQPPPNIPDNRPPQAQQQQNAPNAAANQPNVAAGNGDRRLSFSPSAIAETVLGAILFPTIAGLSGELLRLVLPLSWTTARTGFRGLKASPRGLLQEKWGRSLVGGCLFVVAKDALMLYVRWRMASMHKGRRVLDYDGSKKRAGRT